MYNRNCEERPLFLNEDYLWCTDVINLETNLAYNIHNLFLQLCTILISETITKVISPPPIKQDENGAVISTEQLESGLPLSPLLSSRGGSPSFIRNSQSSVSSQSSSRRQSSVKERIKKSMMTRRPSHYTIPSPQAASLNSDIIIDERDMIMDLVMDISTELDLTVVCHRILQVLHDKRI